MTSNVTPAGKDRSWSRPERYLLLGRAANQAHDAEASRGQICAPSTRNAHSRKHCTIIGMLPVGSEHHNCGKPHKNTMLCNIFTIYMAYSCGLRDNCHFLISMERSDCVTNLLQICLEIADKLWWEGKDDNINRKISYQAY